MGNLGANASLQNGVDVGQKEVIGVEIALRNLGLEIGEDVEVGGQRLGGVQILDVAAGPVEALAGDVFDAGGVNATGGKYGFMHGEEVVADHADDANLGEEAGGESEVRGRATQDALTLAAGGLKGIEGYRTYYKNGQNHSLPRA